MADKPELAQLPEGPSYLYTWAASFLGKPPMKKYTVLHPQRGVLLDGVLETKFQEFWSGASEVIRSEVVVATITLEFR